MGRCRFRRSVDWGRQLESYHSITNERAVFLPVASRMLGLRSAALAGPDASCTQFTEAQLHRLHCNATRKLGTTPTNAEAFLALAELGGHLRSNGPADWLVLGRVFERLPILEHGLTAGTVAGAAHLTLCGTSAAAVDSAVFIAGVLASMVGAPEMESGGGLRVTRAS